MLSLPFLNAVYDWPFLITVETPASQIRALTWGVDRSQISPQSCLFGEEEHSH